MGPLDQTPHPYRGREAALSTKHGKGQMIAPPLLAWVGLRLREPDGVDTDRLGTFTGEVPRVGTPREVALRKARMGMAASGLPLGIANEGSFGPHPLVPFAPADHELLLFVDDELGTEVVQEALSTKTNFAYQTVARADELQGDFLRRAHFPSHGLIVRPNAGPNPGLVFKGITTAPALRQAVDRCVQTSIDRLAHVETDMRAHMNPLRQAVLGELAERLARRLAARCPGCGSPGWGVVAVVRGLRCALCGGETDLVREEIEGCPRCPLRLARPRGDGRRRADPGTCTWCNP